MGGLPIQSSPGKSGRRSTHAHSIVVRVVRPRLMTQAVSAIVILRVGMAHAILGENALKLEEAFGWVLEAGLRVRARMHLVYELGGLDPVPGQIGRF